MGPNMDPDPQGAERSQEESGLVTIFLWLHRSTFKAVKAVKARKAVSQDRTLLSFQCGRLENFSESFRSFLADFRCSPLTAHSSAASEA